MKKQLRGYDGKQSGVQADQMYGEAMRKYGNLSEDALVSKLVEMVHKQKQPKVTTAYISGKIDNISELTTTQLEYNGLIVLSDGKIPFLTQKGFSMRYTASIRAGIDISEVKIDITEKKVTVAIPDAQIQSVNVNSDSVVFYDEKHALFNWTDKEDIVNALSVAKEDAENRIDEDELLEKAKEQTETILKSVLTDSIGDRELIIK